MPYVVGLLAAGCVTLLFVALYELATTPTRAVARELEELRRNEPSPFGSVARRRRQSKREKLGEVIRILGERVERGGIDLEGLGKRLVQAGYWGPEAVRIFLGVRVVTAAGLTATALLVGALVDARIMATLLVGLWLAILGWLIPGWYVTQRRNARRAEIQLVLADALDLLVACVEAGMGLNQALVRVSDEIRNVCQPLAEEFTMVNLEIRAGAPRAQALRNLAERTGSDDIQALVSTLIQTDRFGTSIGRALRVQAETLRQKRRQRAEEAAAKTTIKLLFPLVLFVFPALFVVVLGPGVIQVVTALLEIL
ncbi:MAG: type II secretion system F family protein [Gemmatimonadales bacterium]|nr:MAG: type II secretion system F family protein [Gemmatimonadales bacterium]